MGVARPCTAGTKIAPLYADDRTTAERILRALCAGLVGPVFLDVPDNNREALAMADSIVVMNAGRVEQMDEPDKLYTQPANRFVADFIGKINLLDVEVTSIGKVHLGLFLGHNLYTPRSIAVSAPQPLDRPWAAWLYLGGVAQRARDDRIDTIELDLGLVGPAALGRDVQSGWHRLIGSPQPQGWQHQIPNEPAFMASWLAKGKQRLGSIGGLDVEAHLLEREQDRVGAFAGRGAHRQDAAVDTELPAEIPRDGGEAPVLREPGAPQQGGGERPIAEREAERVLRRRGDARLSASFEAPRSAIREESSWRGRGSRMRRKAPSSRRRSTRSTSRQWSASASEIRQPVYARIAIVVR